MRGDHKDSERTDRHSSRVASAASPVQKSPNTPTPAAQPVQNSPRTPTPAAQPVQNSPNTPKIAHFSPFYPSRENFVPPPPPRSRAGRTLYRTQHHPPVQNSPNTPTPAAQPVQNSPNTPKIAHFSPFCPSRENFLPHPAPPPIQNSPNTPTPAAQPVQNSPNTPKKAHFSQFCPSRENFVPLAPPRPPAGRTLYRTQRQTRYKTLPAPPFYSGSAKKFAQHT